jgi:hypothetical protein
MKEMGLEAFYEDCIANSEFVSDALSDAERVEGVQAVRDWAYRTDTPTVGRAFLCGDSACFIDPLFSQGVHLAAYSARMAAASIDYISNGCASESDQVTEWFDRSYLTAYDRYHRFLSAFYFHCDEPDSVFWDNRRIQGADDARFADQDWFTALAGQDQDAISDLEHRATTLRALWDHDDSELSGDFDETKLSLRRVAWAANLVRSLRKLAEVRWTADVVTLEHSYTVHPTTFKLEKQSYLGDGGGRMTTGFPLGEAHREVFGRLNETPTSHRDLVAQLGEIENNPQSPERIVHRLYEDGFLQGYDENGDPVYIEFAMRFGGVGGDDDLT